MAHQHPARGRRELRYRFPEAGTPFGFYKTDRNSANVTDVALKFIAEKSTGRENRGCCSSPGFFPIRPTRPRWLPRDFENITDSAQRPARPCHEKCQAVPPDYYGMIESLDDESAASGGIDQAGVVPTIRSWSIPLTTAT